MNDILIYIGSAVIFLWGLGHIMATKSVIEEFSSVSKDNHRIITMEWIAEGLTLCFIGIVAFLAANSYGPERNVVVLACAGMLVALAILSSFTGARTSIIPMKLCPFVKMTVVILYVLANFL